jgi:hypothetical protein
MSSAADFTLSDKAVDYDGQPVKVVQ